MNIPLHRRTRMQLEGELSQPLIIIAPHQETANSIVDDLMQKQDSNTLHVLNPDKETIAIDNIRNIKQSAVLQSAKQHTFILHSADNFTVEAQNAFLKTLEEPSTSTVFILAASRQHSLLRTIQSRCKIVEFIQPSNEDIEEFIKSFSANDPTSIKKLLSASDYNFGLVRNAAQSSSIDEHLNRIIAVKAFIQSNTYDRLAYIQRKISSSNDALQLLAVCSTIYSALIKRSMDEKINPALMQAFDLINQASTDIKNRSSYKAVLFHVAQRI